MVQMKKAQQKKIKLSVHGRRTKWAPVWVVLKKYGKGKRVHPSSMTRLRRSWRQNKLKIKPRRIHKQFVG
jgi:ribosomal protein L39E